MCIVRSEKEPFKVYLPAVEAMETLEVQDLELPMGHKELILVVDDETAICEITKTSLETYGYKVITASDGLRRSHCMPSTRTKSVLC